MLYICIYASLLLQLRICNMAARRCHFATDSCSLHEHGRHVGRGTETGTTIAMGVGIGVEVWGSNGRNGAVAAKGLGVFCCQLLNGTRHQKWQAGRIIKLLTQLADVLKAMWRAQKQTKSSNKLFWNYLKISSLPAQQHQIKIPNKPLNK